MNTLMLSEIRETFTLCELNDEVRAVVVAGRGRSFCAGIDLSDLADGHISQEFFVEWDAAMWQVERFCKPVVAAIHGHCVGAGLQLALTADVRITTRGATFALPAAAEGLIPGMSIYRLPRMIGLAKARQMLLFGEVWTAERALNVGLVDFLAPIHQAPYALDDDLAARDAALVIERAQEQAQQLATRAGTYGFAVCKELLSLQNAPVDDLFGQYLELQEQCRQHPDHLQALDNWKHHRQGGIVRVAD